ncbi:MAG: PilZ domain-containing protein [Acidobacteriota bacterium]|nr:PilZ domain-containing protein [Acidobacteriota bacterium]MDH3531063.1 PilZ domain-containing protein [Acidobacteriota bacterium]
MQATLTPSEEKQDTRRLKRIPINLPLKVEGKDTVDSLWEEISRLRDVSSFGAGFTLSRPVKRGRLVNLTLPMPRQMRCYDFFESQYHVWGIVRRCIPIDNSKMESYLIGVAFIGKVPPKTYIDDPAQLYDVSHRSEKEQGLWEIRHAVSEPDESHLPKEDRRHSRYEIPINMEVDAVDSKGNVVESEPTVTENISLGGASIFTSLTVEIGSFLRVTCNQYHMTIKAIVRGRRVGPDGIPRLHIEFIDHFFPLSGIET